MKKLLVLNVLSLFIITFLVGCGKKDKDKNVVYTDDKVALVSDRPIEIPDEDSDSVTEPYTPAWKQYADNPTQRFEKLDKAAYDEFMSNLPKDKTGVVDRAKFSPEQQAMYDKFQNGVYITDFSADDVLADVLDFFSETNLNRIKNLKYVERINKVRGSYKENKDDYKNFVYSATVFDNAHYKNIEADCDYRIGAKHVNFQYDYIINYPEKYYYGYKTEPNGAFFHTGTLNNNTSPLIEVSDLINKGISNFEVVAIDGDIYECSFNVDANLFNQLSFDDKSYIEEVFQKDITDEVRGQVWVNYNTNHIDNLVFIQTLSETDYNLISIEFVEYNNEKFENKFEDVLSYDDAVLLGKFIQAKRDEYMKRPDRTGTTTEEEPETTTEISEEEERSQLEEQMEHLWDTLDVPPEGTTALLDGNGKRIKDTNGHTIFVYKDTFIPYDPTQIPEGMDTPIGTGPVIGALLKPANSTVAPLGQP